MTTRNIVPRGDGEGNLGTAEKQWGAIRSKRVYVDGVDITAQVTAATAKATAAAASATAAAASVTEAEAIKAAMLASYGYPFVASTVADMTDTTKIYVYVGNETGYEFGDWYYYDGNDWVSGGAYNSTAFVLDETLTVSGSPADAKAVGDRIKPLEDVALSETQVDFTSLTPVLTIISANSGKWSGNSDGKYESYFIEIPNKSRTVEIVASETQDTIYAFLAESTHTSGAYPNYATGCSRSVIYANTTSLLAIPSDATFLWIRKTIDYTTDCTPASVTIEGIKDLLAGTDSTLSVDGMAADAAETGKVKQDVQYTKDLFYDGEIKNIPQLLWEAGAYKYTNNGYPLGKLTNSTDYDLIRKRLADLSFTYPFDFYLSVAEGYKVRVLRVGSSNTISESVLISSSMYMNGGAVYGLLLMASDEETDISEIDPNTVIEITTAVDAESVYNAVVPKNLARGISTTQKRRIKWDTGENIEFGYENFVATDYIDISECRKITYSRAVISGTSVPSHGVAFYDSNKTYISGVASQIGGESTSTELYTVDVPQNAKYIRMTAVIWRPIVVYDAVQVANTLPKRMETVESKIDNLSQNWLRLGLHTEPENQGVLNIIKRCRQMTDVEWTPAVDLPRYMRVSATPPYDDEYTSENAKNYLGTFKAGIKYRGIPYGRCTGYLNTAYGYGHHYLGMDIDIETFVTAIQNSESAISKQSVGNLSGHRSVPYALVCSALACYALNVPYTSTAGIPNIPDLNYICPLTSDGGYIDPNTFKLGDIINSRSDHVAVITDLVKDTGGNVVYIEECEAAAVGEGNESIVGGQFGGLCRRVGFTVEEFFKRFGSFYLYRYANIADIPYTPNKFVNVGDELNMARIENLPCMPYMGNKFKYKAGYIPNSTIVINCGGYSYLRVYKDGEEVLNSPYAVPENATAVDVGFSEVGEYEAYLCNMQNGENTRNTAKCYWSVIA